MSLTEFLEIAWKIGAGFGGVAIAIGAFYRLTSKDSRQEKSEMVTAAKVVQDFWQTQAESYKLMMDKKDETHALEIKNITKDFHEKFNKLSLDFGVLQGQYNAEKEARQKAEEILKDRNPETTEFMTKTVHALGEIMKFMEKINIHMEQDLKIESTITQSSPKQ